MEAARETRAPEAPWRTVLRCARPNFLVLAPLCVFLAILVARLEGHAAGVGEALAVLVGALLAHAAVNLLNEHHDHASGLDATTRRTPVSGGSGALPAHPAAAPRVRRAGLACLAGVMAIGAWALWHSGPALLAYGLPGIVLVVAYTGLLTRRPLLCLLAPGLGFGPVMVAGSHQALTGEPSWTALVVALVPGLQVSALLLLNQLPDIDADRRVGRRHLAIVLGPRRAARLAAGLLVAAYLVVPAGIAAGGLPAWSGLAWLALPALAGLVIGLWRLPDAPDATRLVALLTRNVTLLLGTLALLALGLWLAG